MSKQINRQKIWKNEQTKYKLTDQKYTNVFKDKWTNEG